jgi:hypothetical protein
MYWLTIVGCCFSTARKLYSDEKSKLMNKQATPQHQYQQQENPKPRQANVPVNASPLGPLKKEVERIVRQRRNPYKPQSSHPTP